jgi:ribosomal protein S18 acetylase RimI-like enzyme
MDGVDIKPLTFDHRAQADAFAARIPPDERGFLDRTLLSQVSVASWTQATPARRLGAFEDAALLGLVTVDPGTGWTSHVADFRLVVAPEARAAGVGRSLLKAGVALGEELGLRKLTVEVLASRHGPIAMFQHFGFEQEAILRRQACDANGELHDLVVLARFIE